MLMSRMGVVTISKSLAGFANIRRGVGLTHRHRERKTHRAAAGRAKHLARQCAFGRRKFTHRPRPPDMAQYFGIYRAVVMNADDPNRQRRLLVNVPEVLGTALWAMPCVPAGSRAMPRAGAVVWVQFEAGDAARPVWVGTCPGGA